MNKLLSCVILLENPMGLFVQRVRRFMTPNLGNDPEAFFNALNKSGLYAQGKKGTYAAFMVRNDAHNRGPYTYVVRCVSELQQEGLL